MLVPVLMFLLLLGPTQVNHSGEFSHHHRSIKTTNELPGKYCYWCGQENEGDRTTCKRCGRPI